MKTLKRKPELLVVLCCYGLGFALWVLGHLGGFVANRVAYATGGLVQQAVTMDDFEWGEIIAQEDGYLTVGGDPQLLLRDTGLRVEGVELRIRYERAPYMVTAYWAEPGQDHALWRIAYGREVGDAWRIRLPATGGQSLRIDPDARAGNRFWVEGIVLNPKRAFYTFFIPTAGQMVLMCVVPGLVAAGLCTLRQAGLWPKRKKGGGAA